MVFQQTRSLLLLLMLFTQPASANELTVSFPTDGGMSTIQASQSGNGFAFDMGARRTLHLTTLNWGPYIGRTECRNGWVFQVSVSIMLFSGYNVYIEFLPWSRAVRKVEMGEADVLLPEYYIEARAPSDNIPNTRRRELLALSYPFPGGDIGLTKRRDYHFSFSGDLAVLKKHHIGVVRGYQNTPAFDVMMDDNAFSTVQAVDDLQLVRLLDAGRVDLIVGDPLVLEHAITTSAKLDARAKTVLLDMMEHVRPTLANNPLYFAISKKRPNWKTDLQRINQSLAYYVASDTLSMLRQTTVQSCR